MLRIGLSVLVLTLVAIGGALAPNDTHGQAIKPPAAASPPEPTPPGQGSTADQGKGHLGPVPPSAARPRSSPTFRACRRRSRACASAFSPPRAAATCSGSRRW
jgi:hypothetical protein